jgi:hypothetical protein
VIAGLIPAEVVWDGCATEAVDVSREDLGVRVLETLETDPMLPVIPAIRSMIDTDMPIDTIRGCIERGLPVSERQKQLGVIAIYEDEEPARNYQNLLLQRGIETMIQTSIRGANKIVLLRVAVGKHSLTYDDTFGCNTA